MNDQVRPLGITVLAVLALLSAISLGLVGLVVLPSLGTGDGLPAIGFYLLILGSTILSIAVAYGLLTVKPWAWRLAVLSWVLAFIEGLWFLTRNSPNSDLILAPLVLIYLARPQVRRVFRNRG
jgi:hypothetical protein